MKKFSILFAAVAMMALTACNEKPAKNNADAEQAAPAQTEQAAPAEKQGNPTVSVEHAKPTEDGKDHTVAEFNTDDYQARLENLADGTYRLSLWKAGQDKSGKPDQVAETKQCVMNGNTYLMKTADGSVYVIDQNSPSNKLTIMKGDQIVYPKMK